MPEELKENCLKIDCIHYSDYNGKCYKKENLNKEIRQCSDSGRNAVLGEVPNDVEDFIYKVLAVFEFIESGDVKKIDVIKKQANQLIVRYGLDK